MRLPSARILIASLALALPATLLWTAPAEAVPGKAPVVTDDQFSMQPGETLTVAAPGVLDNDYDVDSSFSLGFVSAASVGDLEMKTNGGFTYYAQAAFEGDVTFTYKAIDTTGLQSTLATVTITIATPNQAPTGVADTYSTVGGVSLVVPAATGLLANDTDPDGDALVVDDVSMPGHGTLSMGGVWDGAFTYAPAAGFVGTDTFQYRMSDPEGAHSAWTTATITVVAPNQAPVGVPDAYSTTSGVPLVVPAATGVLANDTDPDGDALMVDDMSMPGHGSLAVTGQWDGNFTYTPAPGFVGTDTFQYQAGDVPDDAHSQWVTVTVTVLAATVPASPVPVSLDLGPVAAAHGGATVPVTGHVTSAAGPVAGAVVVVSIGATEFTGTTGPSGDAVIKVRLPKSAGHYVLSGRAGKLRTDRELTVGTAVTGRVIVAPTVHRGTRFVARGRIGTTRATLAVTLLGPGGSKHTYTTRTSARGGFTLRLPAGATARKGRYRVRISYVPDAQHFAAKPWTRTFRSVR